MPQLPPSPLIYEINTWPWLARLTLENGRPVTLGTVPDVEWDAIAESGFHAVWLMGVWRRSAVGVAIACADEPLMDWFASALPDFRSDDVVGSPYCVRDYVVDDHLGGPDGLAHARRALADRGVALILDHVPNHVALDHPWVAAHPSWFVTGDLDDLDREPESYVLVDGAVIANGRDPYFPAWRDVVQLNAFSPGLRAATLDTLRQIAGQCDGVRCDMAMLMMNDVFARTWGASEATGDVGASEATGDVGASDEFWPGIIAAIRAEVPGFCFIAEAYWGTEPALRAQGFDHCYDKSLYDTLREDPAGLRAQLSADPGHQRALLRFIENHDEPRSAASFGERDELAAVATLTQLGARLVHDGQLQGRRIRVPVQLGRFPDEPVDAARADFYRGLLAVLRDDAFAGVEWGLVHGADASDTGVVAAWRRGGRDGEWLVVVNPGDRPATVRLACRTTGHELSDPLSGESIRVGDDGTVDVSLPAWGRRIYH
ncbi:alpha-amylase family protein [Gordonia insulae]|uniref:Alpha-1,4-glucan:maltose-1-phosphate maltosyltransferase n=1 Tax=Gordonia insulae TaxID=2420509 RepID=A0A3G8JVY1_9ACTN|nr:alpha-amylase family glycosyl hydrolase [Gordonia insulae]AZG48340.1 Alpha-1,4-glucan:maltose-1-phosphate maltosyltransferase [Gordonia insulae]